MNTANKGVSVRSRLGLVYVAVEVNWAEQKILGVYSTVDSALESCHNYLEKNHPHTLWVWDGVNRLLENDVDEYHHIYLLDYQVDNDQWRPSEKH